MPNSDQITRHLKDLTPRQSEILYMVCTGLTYPQIAERLYISEHTVQSDMSKIYKRFGMKGESMPRKRQRLGSEVCPIHLQQFVQSHTPVDNTELEPADERDIEEVARDAKNGLIPIRALVVVNQPPSNKPPDDPAPVGGGSLVPKPSPRPVPPPIDKGKTFRDFLIGVLATLFVLTLCLLGVVLAGGSERFVALWNGTATPAVATVIVTEKAAAPPPVPPKIETVLVTASPLAPAPPVVVTVIVREPTTTPADTPVPVIQTVVVTPPATIFTEGPAAGSGPVPLPFSDDFENGIRPEWIRAGGEWNMSNRRLRNAGERGTIWLGEAEWKDIMVEADIQGSTCVFRGDIQLLVRMQDPGNYILINLLGCANEGIFVVREGQDTLQLVHTNNNGKHFKIELTGQIIKVEIDGQPVWSASDEVFGSGSVGIQMSQNGTIDNLIISERTP